jgi:microcystin-dependent protein
MEAYIGQIQPFGFNFAPKSWATCQGQILPISQFSALFSLLGTSYGGDGRSNFGLPNLTGSVAIGAGAAPGLSDYVIGETAGAGSVTILNSEMPMHTHSLTATTSAGTVGTAAGNQLASGSGGGGKGGGGTFTLKMYSTAPTKATTMLPPMALTLTGGNGAHNNMQPYLAINFCIALAGNFPPRG